MGHGTVSSKSITVPNWMMRLLIAFPMDGQNGVDTQLTGDIQKIRT
jgi:hypothetical protein